jgi:hypothetical protein
MLSLMENILIELKYTLIGNFININIQNYDYGTFEDLFYLIEKSVNHLLPTSSHAVTNTSISNEYIHIILKDINPQNALCNKLSFLFNVKDFIINNVEVSLLH